MTGTFKKANSFFRKGLYSEVIRLLEPQIFRFRDSSEFYYLLGVSCVYTSDIGSAQTYLKRAADLDHRNVNILLALAMVHMYRQENSDALRCWLQVLELEPGNKKARRGLSILKSSLKQEFLNDEIEEGKLDKLLPEKRRSERRTLPILILLLVLILAGTGIPFLLKKIPPAENRGRQDFQSVDINDFSNILENRNDSLFVFTQEDLKKNIDKINDLLLSYHDNLAMREINRILLSNAHDDLKNKISLLEKNIVKPSFATFSDNFTYQEVKKEPLLYRRCFVVWKGRATNLSIGEDEIRFDFLVDYEDEKELSGIVPVILNFSADVTLDFPLEILAEIIPDNAGGFFLSGISIHRLW